VHLERVVQLFPGYAPAQSKIADVLAMHGRIREAIEHYHAVLLYRPDTPIVMNNLAWILATNEDPDVRDSAEAVRLAEGACALTRRQVALFVGTLAAAYADAGRFDDAVKAAQEACATATAAGETRLAEKNRQLLELYRAGKPYREPAATVNPAPAQ
jgi:predicted Zn-dependent protease